ncbi:hydrogenase maturation protease [Mycolicibacterium mucogenicum]|uniref:Hydrogenase maturation protease n=1 Tax=Mycolicibacterium mucogenicum DSM 44124 TaxID=1226753 RepID=A0A8H2PH37_MYCMU|nr:hydrogenase maturation protease [Mycolicibacterium mucogenicum]KAB7755406.1 peptidase M52 [Mycolicibacterium mucogenicum DSM 44124]QPG68147.1 hydrogenase maturation protease [Mycolicibacterium mucogenicum DSM 44124]
MRAVTCACGGCDGGDATHRILIAGIGNIFLGDDGFGPEVLRHIGPVDPRVRLTDYGIRGMHLAYDLLAEWDALVLVDALPSQGAPGTVHVFEADHQSLTAAVGLDAHAMDPATVFASLNALGGRAPHTVVVGCEVVDVEHRMGLSDVVAAAVPAAVRTVEDVVAELVIRTPVREG